MNVENLGLRVPLDLSEPDPKADLINSQADPRVSPTDLLLRWGKLTQDALDRAVRSAADSGDSVEAALTSLGLVPERDLAMAFSQALGCPIAMAQELPRGELPPPAVSVRFLRQFRVLPMAIDETGISLAMANPLDDYAAEAVALFAGKPVRRMVATASDIDAAVDRLQPDGAAASVTPGEEAVGDDVERLRDLASDAPVVRLVNQIIARSVEARASDIHIEPALDRLIVRYRIDGVMREVEAPSLRLRDAVVSRVKIMAKLNIAERRLPQDGRMSFSVRGTEIDFRVSTGYYGDGRYYGDGITVTVVRQAKLAGSSRWKSGPGKP